MSKTIVIVGNGKPDADVSAAVDAADEVVRFGKTPYFNRGWTGQHTTALTLRAFLLRHVPSGCFPRLDAADAAWILDDENYRGHQCIAHEDEDELAARMLEKYRPRLVATERLRDKRIEFPSSNVRSDLRELFRSKGFGNGTSSRTEPSAGVWVTVWVVAHPRYTNWNVKLAGFAMEYPLHPAKYEGEVLTWLREEGRIEML